MNNKHIAKMRLINVIGGSIRSRGICPTTEACTEGAALEVGVRGQGHSQHIEIVSSRHREQHGTLYRDSKCKFYSRDNNKHSGGRLKGVGGEAGVETPPTLPHDVMEREHS